VCFRSEGSHLPDLGVTVSGSVEVVNLDVVSTGWKLLQVDGTRVALSGVWLGAHLLEVVIKKEITVSLWSIRGLATGEEKSLWVLDAVNNNILLYAVVELDETVNLSVSSENLWVSFISGDYPVISVVSVESLGVKLSPFIKRNPEFSLVGFRETSLLSPSWSPEATVLRPWSGIFAETPWVSHLNKFVHAFSVFVGEAETLEDTVSVTSNKVVVTNCTSSSHWVSSLSSVLDNSPEFIISHLAGLMGRYWHTGKGSKSSSWNTTVELSVVDVQLSESFLKKD